MKHALRTLLVAAATAGLALTGVTTARAVDDSPAGPKQKAGYTLDFDEEFDGTTLNTDRWSDSYLPHWTKDPARAKARYSIQNGVLTERIDQTDLPWNPDYDGNVRVSSIQTYERDWWHRFNGSMPNDHHEKPFDGYTFKYGYVEMRAKMSDAGGGGHQALWLVGTEDTSENNGNSEIDMVETWFGKKNTWRIENYGWGDPNFVWDWTGCDCNLPAGMGDPTTGFHTYGMDWTPTGLAFYYDGVLVRTIDDAPNAQMALILGIYTNASSGAPNDVWPKSWAVDYLRVYKKNTGYPNVAERLWNRNLGSFLVANDDGTVGYGKPDATDARSQWVEETTSDGFTRLRNRATGAYLSGKAGDTVARTVGAADAGANAEWTLENPNGYKVLKNRATGLGLNVESQSGHAELGTVGADWWSAQWGFDYLDAPLAQAPAWSPSTRYSRVGETVSYRGRTYALAWQSFGQRPGDVNGPWQEVGANVATPLGAMPAWTPSQIYRGGEQIAYRGHVYRAAWYSRGQTPGSVAGAWLEVGLPVQTASGTHGAWTASMIYQGGEKIVYRGHVYEAKWYSRNQVPTRGFAWRDLGEA